MVRISRGEKKANSTGQKSTARTNIKKKKTQIGGGKVLQKKRRQPRGGTVQNCYYTVSLVFKSWSQGTKQRGKKKGLVK